MVAYFARRLIGVVVTFLASTFLFYSLIFFRGDPIDKPHFDMPAPGAIRLVNEYYGIDVLYARDEPWPTNYLMWLFALDRNPHRTFPVFYSPLPHNENHRDILRRDREGLLFGDSGVSLWIAPGIPVQEMYGIDLPTFFAFTLTPIFLLMLVTSLQRIGRHPLRGYSPEQARQLYSMEAIRLLG